MLSRSRAGNVTPNQSSTARTAANPIHVSSSVVESLITTYPRCKGVAKFFIVMSLERNALELTEKAHRCPHTHVDRQRGSGTWHWR
jgi:hypothetical protein